MCVDKLTYDEWQWAELKSCWSSPPHTLMMIIIKKSTTAKCQGIPRCMMRQGLNCVKCHCGCCTFINNHREGSKEGNKRRFASWLSLFFVPRQMVAVTVHVHLWTFHQISLKCHKWTTNPVNHSSAPTTPGLGCTRKIRCLILVTNEVNAKVSKNCSSSYDH